MTAREAWQSGSSGSKSVALRRSGSAHRLATCRLHRTPKRTGVDPESAFHQASLRTRQPAAMFVCRTGWPTESGQYHRCDTGTNRKNTVLKTSLVTRSAQWQGVWGRVCCIVKLLQNFRRTSTCQKSRSCPVTAQKMPKIYPMQRQQLSASAPWCLQCSGCILSFTVKGSYTSRRLKSKIWLPWSTHDLYHLWASLWPAHTYTAPTYTYKTDCCRSFSLTKSRKQIETLRWDEKSN